jgi:protein SCO1
LGNFFACSSWDNLRKGVSLMRKFLFCLLLAALLGCSGKSGADKSAFFATDISGSKLGNNLGMIDQLGRMRYLSDFKGKVVALFFGYTHCPDVCPTTLADLAKAMRLMGEGGNNVQVLFVTLDPERDTADVIRRYVPSFDPRILGLRGDEDATKEIAKAYKIFFAKQQPDASGNYTVDHGVGVYVFDKKGILRLYLNYGQSPADIAHDFGVLSNE